MKLLCRLGWHDWNPWSDEKGGDAGIVYQIRSCPHCNIIERRTIFRERLR